MDKNLKVGIVAVVAILVALIFNPISCVSAQKRGVRIMFGAAKDGVVNPGIALHVPVFESIKTYSIEPTKTKLDISVGGDGAITKDNQTVGVSMQLYWRFIPERVSEIAQNYTGDKLEQVLKDTGESSAKTAIGAYTIFDLAAAQNEISNKIRAAISSGISGYPIELTDVKLTNFDWSDDFDKQISLTMEKAQQVKQKEQELQIASFEAQKQVAQAEAAKSATIARAEGEKEKVRLEAEAKVLEGEGIRKYNDAIAKNMNIEMQLRNLEIEKIKAEKWDGKYVPNNMYGPIPVDTVGGLKK